MVGRKGCLRELTVRLAENESGLTGSEENVCSLVGNIGEARKPVVFVDGSVQTRGEGQNQEKAIVRC